MKPTVIQFTKDEIEINHKIFMDRMALYKNYGIDHEELRKKIINELPENTKSVLEIGTGKGYLTTILAQNFDRIISVDNDRNENRIAMLNAAYNNLSEKIEFITADAGSLNYPDRSFDAVVSSFTFHHLTLPFKVIREMTRLAVNTIVISDFSTKGFETIRLIHNSEGKNHEIKPGEFDIVGIFLKELNFNVKVIKDEWQIIYSAQRKKAGEIAYTPEITSTLNRWR